LGPRQDLAVERHRPAGLAGKGELIRVLPRERAPRSGIEGDGTLERGRGIAVGAPFGRLAREADRGIEEGLARILVRRLGLRDGLPGRDCLIELAAPQQRESKTPLARRRCAASRAGSCRRSR
jgi:hypothetical protein